MTTSIKNLEAFIKRCDNLQRIARTLDFHHAAAKVSDVRIAARNDYCDIQDRERKKGKANERAD